jgi:hypothetical protein
MPPRRLAVIDSNIIIAANGKSDQANSACVENCIDVLMEVTENSSLALDDAGEIVTEYKRYGSYSGQPGVGDRFFLWVHQNQHRACHRVQLTLTRVAATRNSPTLKTSRASTAPTASL